MNRRSFLQSAGGFALGATVARSASAAAPQRKPNVILLYADDLGIGDVGCYGCRDIATPNLDALAASGARLTSYYSAAPVCSPSRAALLTGLSPQRAGVPGNVRAGLGTLGLPRNRATLAEVLKPLGYATAIVGKWHLGTAPVSHPNQRGFDLFFGHVNGCISYYSHVFSWDKNLGPVHDLWRNGQEVHEDGQYMTDLITRESLRFIDASQDRPFMLYAAYNAPHYPMEAPQPWLDRYATLSTNRRPYAAMVGCLDGSIGRIVARVRELGLLGDTLILFASDNGPSDEARTKIDPKGPRPGWSGPYRGDKFSLLEGGIRMPCIASWPGRIDAGTVNDRMAIAMDALPTIAAAAGARCPDGLDGLNHLADGEPPADRPLFWESGGQRAVRRGPWKLLVPQKREPQLYNLEADPGEARDLAAAEPRRAAELLALHEAWRATWKKA